MANIPSPKFRSPSHVFLLFPAAPRTGRRTPTKCQPISTSFGSWQTYLHQNFGHHPIFSCGFQPPPERGVVPQPNLNTSRPLFDLVKLSITADTGEYIDDAYSLAMFRHILNMELHRQFTHASYLNQISTHLDLFLILSNLVSRQTPVNILTTHIH
jgi:hypothetical protein